MDSILEQQRNWHEERERCVDLMTKEMNIEKRSQKEKLNSEQRVKSLIDRFQSSSQRLIEAYEDKGGERDRETQAIGAPNEFAEFYSRLKNLKDFHRKSPNENARPLTIEFQEMAAFAEDPERLEKEVIRFTDEEGYGKFLDMHTLFVEFLNVKGIKRTDYNSYISGFDQFGDIPKETRKSAAYKNYLNSLLDYLKSFLSRSKPLLDQDGELAIADKEFEQKWAENTLPGWTREKQIKMPSKAVVEAVPLDLAPIHSIGELEALGMDRIKSALMALGMKCGGTLRERAERLFNTKGKSPDELPKAPPPSKSDRDQKEEKRQQEIARGECRISRLSAFLEEERASTKENVERRQARAAGEEEEEDAEEMDEFIPEEVEDDSIPYNPKNLPLAWDGKPIPYWLYKLHGLNIGYSCEICGNQVYKGPKTFQRHFTEWRHSHGMRCLGIPNTPHFMNVTKIADAITLWQKICTEKNQTRWNPEIDEEFEDSLGNVVSRRTFEDLKRQGLL